jgi:hypothetical protein
MAETVVFQQLTGDSTGLLEVALWPLPFQIPRRISRTEFEIVGQPAAPLGLGGRPEQGRDQPGIGLQGADLGRIPPAGGGRVHIQGADRAAAELDWDAQPRPDLQLDKGQGDLAPVGLEGGVTDDRRPAAGEGLQAGAGGEGFLVVFQGLGERVRGAGPARLPSASASMIPAASTANSC